MPWPSGSVQLHDAALDFADQQPGVKNWLTTVPFIAGTTAPSIRAVYGMGGRLGHFHNVTFESADDLTAALCENHGGGVPIEVIHPVVQAAADAERRARAIAGVAASIRELLDGAAVSVNRRPLREAMYFWWSAARLRGSLRYRGKYPLAIRWSLEADATRKREEPGLVLDHSVPFLVVANHLIGACDRRDDFIHHLLSDQMVVITKQEDEMITANGHRDSLPESGDPDDRYVGVVPGWTVPAHFR